jgi:hypothetical protein
MGLTTKLENTLKCDREGCKVEIVYDPQPKNPTQNLPTMLQEVVSVEHPYSGYKRLYCGADCAVLDLSDGKHKPPVANLVVPAGPNDVASVAHNARETAKLKAK